MNNVVRYGIAGCGMMGVEHINNINLLEGAEVVAVYDPVTELAQKATDIARSARIMQSFEDLIMSADVDALVIVSPNHCHLQQLEMLLEKRSIPVLCEKPLFTRSEDLDRIKIINAKFPAPIWVAMEYRYMPPIAEFIKEVDEVTGGIKMLTIREHRFPFLEKIGDWNRFNKNTGGTLVEKCCHFFDLMRLLFRAEPMRVMASAGQMVNHLEEDYQGKIPDIWDGGYVIVDFPEGKRAMLELCMFAEGSTWNEEITAVGSKGKLECQIPGPQRFWPADLGPPPTPQLVFSPRNPSKPVTKKVELDQTLVMAGDHHGSTFFQHQRFLEVVRGNAKPEVTFEDGMKAVQMGLAAQKSATDHTAVEL